MFSHNNFLIDRLRHQQILPLVAARSIDRLHSFDEAGLDQGLVLQPKPQFLSIVLAVAKIFFMFVKAMRCLLWLIRAQ